MHESILHSINMNATKNQTMKSNKENLDVGV